LAGPEQAIPAERHHHGQRVRIRRRKKFWRRPSWWSNVGRSIVAVMLAVAVLFFIYLVWTGVIAHP
jgi:K+-transporting ATPase A subunit